MASVEKTVFISYRRTDVYTALAVYQDLKNHGYDIFFDYRSISSGAFEKIIISNIKARAHFLLILTPTALDRCSEPGDWLRREIETAIDEKRNIIPLLFKGFQFGTPSVSKNLTGKLKNLGGYNGLNVHEDYFDEAMYRLRTQFLNVPLDTILHPVSTLVQNAVMEEQVAADEALRKNEEVKELVKQVKESAYKPKVMAIPGQGKSPVTANKPSSQRTKYESMNSPESILRQNKLLSRMNLRLISGVVASLLVLTLLLWAGINLFNGTPVDVPEATLDGQLTPSNIPQSKISNTSTPTKTMVSDTTEAPLPTPTIGMGLTMTGKDDMLLLYVLAGEFTMGSNAEDSFAECRKLGLICKLSSFTDEEPAHNVFLKSFWIDQTEVTNKMYSLCVNTGDCQPPRMFGSFTRSSYYSNPEFDNYPVIYVNWYMAKAYCEWVGRRLPTEPEWEKAARGESALLYPWGNEFDGTRVNFCDSNCSLDWAVKSFDDGFADTSPVGNYPLGSSLYGALDMAGNVWEWTADLYAAYPGGNPDARDEYGQNYYVMRGGSWGYYDSIVRSAYRGLGTPDNSREYIGFRCAMDAQ